MAKKKLEIVGEDVIPEESDIRERIQKEIEKDLGKGIFVSGNEIIRKPRTIISVSPAIDPILGGGIPEGSWVVLTGKPKAGKAQTLDSLIQTPEGPKLMGEIQAGDIICDANGGTCKVTGVHPQGKKDIYKVTFTDKDSVKCCGEHLWEVTNRNHKKKKEILETLKIKDIIRFKHANRPRWSVRVTEPVLLNSRDVTIDPYLLGLLIGDGSILRSIKFTTADPELVESIRKIIGNEYQINKTKKTIDYIISKSSSNKHNNKYIEALKKYGLWGHLSKVKFIPEDYKYNSIEVRKDIIQGLMDTDGYIDKRGNAIFYTSSPQLAIDFKEIINSLGGLCSITDKKTICNGKWFNSFACQVKTEDNSELFRLDRKKTRARIRRKPSRKRMIWSIEYCGKEEAQCITVDSKDQLYLTDYFIPTHNSSLALSFARNCQKPIYGSRNVYYLNVEGRIKKRDLEGIKGLNIDQMRIIESTEDKILTSQDYLTIAEKILMTDKKCVLIIDSISALCDEREMTGGIGTQTRGGGARLVAQFTSQMGNVVPVKGSILVCVLHLMANTSGYGSPIAEKGGNAIQYQVDVKLRAEDVKPWPDKGSPIGQVVTWKAYCTAIGPPGRSCESYLRYGEGIDELMEIITAGKEVNLIGGSAQWPTLDYLKNHLDVIGVSEWTDETAAEIGARANGQDKLRKLLESNTQWADILKEELKAYA